MRRQLDEMVPAEIVKELDKYIIGQDQAKRVVAIALRNRVRRRRVSKEMQEEISPKNIIMIGSTGVGKTEIARRLSKLSGAPFVKVEASKYTEVGYVGRDVESMVRDLMGVAVQMVKTELAENVREEAERRAEEHLLDILLPGVKKAREKKTDADAPIYLGDEKDVILPTDEPDTDSTREKFRKMLREGKLDSREVEVSVSQKPSSGIEILTGNNMDDIQSAMSSIGNIFGGKQKKRHVTVKRAKELLIDEEMEKLVDMDKASDLAKERVEQLGIIFIDEIDKVATGKSSGGRGPDVSREGVQRDILPIVEGSKVNTKHGVIDTSHILFIAAGAFHISKPSDLIPELQGRFPLRVELSDLTSDDFYRILKEPENAIIMQYQQLLATEEVTLEFDDQAIRRMSEIAVEVNKSTENIGARRLHTIMERLLEDVSFNADQLKGQVITITKSYVDERLYDIIEDRDLSRYIL